jgi:hypothetical protein
MARKGQFRAPEDKSVAIAKAMRIYGRARAKIAFFFIGGKLFGCQSDRPQFEKRVNLYANTLVGVYDINRSYREILDDLDAYYQMAEEKKLPPLSPLLAPRFRDKQTLGVTA